MVYLRKEPRAAPVGALAVEHRETQPENGSGSADNEFMAYDDKRLTKF